MKLHFPQTEAALRELYQDLSNLENDLRDLNEPLEGVQLEKKITWAKLSEQTETPEQRARWN